MISIKILLAIDNKDIKLRIDKRYGNRVYIHDINCMEDVIEFLSNRKERFIVITRDSLQGNIDKKLYVKQLRLANEKSKIVYIVDKLTQEYKEFLFANEVFNIIEGKNISFDILTNYIDNPKDIIYRNIDNINKNEKGKRVIGVCGTSGVGKSLVSSLIAKDFATLTKENIILLDMNIKNPSIDILNNLDSNNKGLYQYMENQSTCINNYLIRKLNLAYMVNKPVGKLKFNKKKLDDLYSFILDNYSYSFIDLSSDNSSEYTKFWLKRVTDIFVIVNPNYLNVRRTINYLEELKDKNIFIIINAIKSGSLDISQIKSLIPEYKIEGKIYYGRNIESCINGAVSELELDYDFYDLHKEFDISNKVNIKNIYLETYRKFKENLEKV